MPLTIKVLWKYTHGNIEKRTDDIIRRTTKIIITWIILIVYAVFFIRKGRAKFIVANPLTHEIKMFNAN